MRSTTEEGLNTKTIAEVVLETKTEESLTFGRKEQIADAHYPLNMALFLTCRIIKNEVSLKRRKIVTKIIGA